MFLVLFSCSKNKYNTKPQVKVNSFGPGVVNSGQTISLKATITDKEGDIQDSILLVKKIYNITTSSLVYVDTIRFSVKDFGNPLQSKIELDAIFNYGQIVDGTIYIGQESADRLLGVGIIVYDKGGHKSDYVETNKIVLKKT
ncbi:MAG: hypothetical protein NVS9B7_02430 [Flavisolibacter sp.]